MREIIISEPVRIGKCGEDKAAAVLFPVSQWYETYGGGGIFILHVQKPKASSDYAFTLDMTVSDGYAAWIVRQDDLSVIGKGKAQLWYYVDDTIAKSELYTTIVESSL